MLTRILLILCLLVLPVLAQSPTPTPAAAPTPIAVSDLPAQLEAASAHLEEVQAQLATDASFDKLQDGIPALQAEVDARLRETAGIVNIEDARRATGQLQALARRVAESKALLQTKAQSFTDEIDRLKASIAVLKVTEPAAQANQAPPQLVTEIHTLLTNTTRVVNDLRSRRTETLKIRASLSDSDTRLQAGLQGVTQSRTVLEERLFRQDSGPLWSVDVYRDGSQEMGARLQQALASQAQGFGNFLRDHGGNVFVQLALMGLLYLGLTRVKAFVAPFRDSQPRLQRSLQIFQEPGLLAVIFGLAFSGRLYPDAPPGLHSLLALGSVLLATRLVAHLLSGHLAGPLWVLVALYATDMVRGLVAGVPLAARLIFLVEMIAGALMLIVYAANRREPLRANRKARFILGAFLAAFSLAALADLTGFVSMAYLVGNAALHSAYLALFLRAILSILGGLTLLAMLVPPLTMLNSVNHHRARLHSRIRKGLGWLLIGFWCVATLEWLSLFAPLAGLLTRILSAQATVGALHFSLGSAVVFVLIITIAMALSRMVRFALQEDVFPRVHLSRGLPYALSTLVHYLLLTLGFLVATAAAGLDASRFAFLAGALGVGLGLGLQNIVNNFVSGLILLFERPVKQGDRIKIGEYTGELQSIGLRASVVHTAEGSEVIVPNGELISAKVVNWTPGTVGQRQLEIPVKLKRPADPEEALQVLGEVAQEQAGVATAQPMLLEFGTDTLGMQVRVTTGESDWMQVRSRVLVALHKALEARGMVLA